MRNVATDKVLILSCKEEISCTNLHEITRAEEILIFKCLQRSAT